MDGANASPAITRSPILDDGSNFFYNESSIPEDANTMGIYVLAPQGEWATGGDEAMLLNNIEGIGTKTSKTTDEGAIDNDVKKISLKTVGKSQWGGVYYYPMVTKYNYTFYGYAPYQSTTGTVSTTNTKVTFNNFDGSQDIMYATASAPTVAAEAIWINSSYEENTTELHGYNAKYIRQLKYHKELNDAANTKGKTPKEGNHPWVPNLEFAHKLTWLKFAVVAATEQSAADKIEAKKLKVKDIKILNHGNTATLDILDGTLSFSGTETLEMKNASEGTFTDDKATGIYQPEDPTNPTIRGYLLVNPSDTYKVQLTVEPEENAAGVTPPSQTFNIDLKIAGGSFEAGKSYLIKLGIYAMQEVEATASVIAWGNDTIVEFPVE
ncbi:MAG: hypothetical protein ACI4C3_07340 [Bacteroides sp.]